MSHPPLVEKREHALPLVSLVTPSYNALPYLRKAIDSVLDQDYPHIEYLVMDGGSTDGTPELLESYGDQLNWVSAQDAGQADAIARGMERTRGAILGWLNADDLLKPGAITTAVNALLANPEAALVYGNADFIDSSDQVIGPCTVVEPFSRHRLLYYGDYIIQPAAFFTRAAYQSVGGIDSSLHWALDWDLWIRLAQDHQVVYLDALLASYRWLGVNKTATGGTGRLEEVAAVARRYGCNGLPAYFRLEQARLFASLARRDFDEGRYLATLNHLARSGGSVLSSWRALKSLFNRHVWLNYRTAQTLYRHTTEAGPGPT